MKIDSTTTRGQTRIKGESQRAQVVSVQYEIDGGLPMLNLVDAKQGFEFDIVISKKVLRLLSRIATIELDENGILRKEQADV